MRITFLGGADEVGATCILIEIAGRRLLIDAGVRPSPKARAGLGADQLPDLAYLDHPSSFVPRQARDAQDGSVGNLDAILVTHAHTDHTGALELVVGQRNCPVYATPLTIALTRVLHADSQRIMLTRLDEEGELPLYDAVATEKLLAAFKPVPFNVRVPLGNPSTSSGVSATFFHAGHIAGAAMIGIESSDARDGGRVLISGDVSISPQRTVDGVKPPSFQPDVLVLESTYGGRLHANRAAEERRLVETISRIVEGGGKVLIPAFALGRAQEIILTLNEFRRRKLMPDAPVWVDGMVRAVCAAYAGYVEYLPLALQERGANFFEGNTRAVERPDQRSALIWSDEPAVIVASSGMLAGGPSLEYAKAFAGQPQHAILLTGYQDEESPGRRLQEMAQKGRGALWLGKDKVDVQCALGVYSLSAHADEAQLVSLTEALNPRDVFLVHGDAPARESMARALRDRNRLVHLPRAGQSFEFQLPPALVSAASARAATFVFDEAAWARTPEAQPASAAVGRGPMEPNQALAFARAQFPPEARLRRVGYLLDQHAIKLTFDFPDVARAQFAEAIERLADETGWSVEIEPQTNTAALQTLAGELLGMLLKPATVRHETRQVQATPSNALDSGAIEAARTRFEAASGYTLQVVLPASPAPAALSARTGGRMEINTAYAALRAALAGSTLYRTSLKDGAIVLSFISPQVGERYRAQLDALEAQVGYRLTINPSPNQGAILDAARAIAAREGWPVAGSPSIFVARAEVALSLAAAPEANALARAQAEFESQTGFTLRVTANAPANLPASTALASATPASTGAAIRQIEPDIDVVQVPLHRIRLSRAQQGLALDPLKVEKAIDRARRMGITPPVRVRRLRDEYLLLDGLYRVKAAEALGMSHVPGTVED
jgi:Cft2 family RNA processing exonuclease